MTGTVLLLALAASSEILLPPWSLSPDGDLVGVRGGAALVAEGASVEPAGPGLYRVVPAPGPAEVTLSAGGARATAAVDREIGTIAIGFEPSAPVKGRDRAIVLDISVPGSGEDWSEERAPHVVASTGRIRDLTALGPGRFRAVLEPAGTRYPEVAVVLALAPRCPLCPTPRAAGYAIVPLSAAIRLPGTSEPGVETTMTIGGRAFGPVAADRDGRFSIPVVVPPGAHLGTAVSVDRLGNTRRTEVDLSLPPVDRLACAAWPRVLPADGRSAASVWCIASTAAGAPASSARLELAASRGEVGALAPFREALQRARFVAPPGGGGTDAVLAATYPGGGPASAHEVRIALAKGAPAEISATLARDPVPLGATVAGKTEVRDLRGDDLGPASGPPGAEVGFVASDRFVARGEAADYTQQATLSFALAPGSEVARLSLRRERGAWVAEARTVDARPAAGARLRFGSGLFATTDARGRAVAPSSGGAEWVAAESGARAAGWEGITPPPLPFEMTRTLSVALGPPTSVDILVRVEGGRLRWRVLDAEGRELARRAVVLRAAGVVLGPAGRDGEGESAEIRGGRGTVAVVDVETGVAAVVEVP